MKKRLAKKMLVNYNCEWRYGRIVPLRSEREEKGRGPVTFLDYAKFVRRNYFDPTKFNHLRPFLEKYMLREELIGTAAGDYESAHRFVVCNRQNGHILSIEEYHKFLKLMGLRWLPYELGQLLVANETIAQGEDILPDLPDPDLPDDDDWDDDGIWEGDWDDGCEFHGTVY